MCGHFGAMGPGINGRDLDILQELGIVSQLRGRDGAGVFQCKSIRWSSYGNYRGNDTEDVLYKSWSPFSSYLHEVEGSKNYRTKQIMNSTSVDIIMGHVRASTKGVISDANAHPFELSNIVGAHNGTLKDLKYLGHPTKTDSELMFRDINEKGLAPTLNELNRDSAFAIVMYDKRERAMYFVRNEMRSFHFAFIKSRAVLYWASEYDMLKYVLHRNGETDVKFFNLTPRLVVKVEAADIYSNNFEAAKETFQIMEHLTIPVPTGVQRILDEKAKAEAAKTGTQESTVVAKETPHAANFTKHTDALASSTTGGTTNVVPLQKKEEPKGQSSFLDKDVGTHTIQTPRGKVTVKSCYARCSCGKATLTLLEANHAMRGKSSTYSYTKVEGTTGKFHCASCKDEAKPTITPEEKAEVERAIG